MGARSITARRARRVIAVAAGRLQIGDQVQRLGEFELVQSIEKKKGWLRIYTKGTLTGPLILKEGDYVQALVWRDIA